MMDPFGNMQNMLGQFQGFMSNPMAYMMQCKLNIPQEYMNDPNKAIQHLMNTGKVSQQQYDWAMREAQKIMDNTEFKDFINRIQTQK